MATFLVAHVEILPAQARLGHADVAATLREYGYALPLTDKPVADALNQYLDNPTCRQDAAHRETRATGRS